MGKIRLLSIIILCTLLCISSLTVGGQQVGAVGYNDRPSTDNALGLQVKSALLIEFETGQVMYEVNPDEALPIASMTKLMTEYIVMKEIENGRLAWDQIITVTPEASDTHPSESQIYLATGDQHTVEELYIAMAVGSANDATKALAIAVEGSIQAFIDRMNETADQLGLTSAVFTSVTGLEDSTMMSARDVVSLARTILIECPDFLKYSGMQEYQFRERDTAPIINFNYMLGVNTNKSGLKHLAYEGVDGLKTGFISAAGYNFAGTVERDGVRYISVVMDTRSKDARFLETASLYNHAFATFEKKTVIAPKSVVEGYEKVNIKKGVEKAIPVVTGSDVTVLTSKGTEAKVELVSADIMAEDELIAPIAAGTKVGTLNYKFMDPSGKELQYQVDLLTTEDAEKASWFKLFFRGLGNFFSDLFDSIMNIF
ncbi:MAG: D-alanyl-D-alanine carboxypeptidase [Candidatus Pristimantibacillus lignocellulolyticus]|uniref:serine-type D-Ala-D-Ala carboxypeptidase n=1 Tax=Candidatus Pristimantibacillus lignocellulolyticus TaxID=2994561 RepID=A0A9J6ZJM4_9BACL|nr:MAG: D-alanyl-D-alanine carboxypeptidase [Candidatus Pristimantibacillus lignocellulolyticus]